MGLNYISFPGAALSYASLPDSYDWSTGVCVSIRLTPSSWTPAAFQVITAQYDGAVAQSSWGFFINSGAGGITVISSANGTTKLYNTTIATQVQLGSPTGALWLRLSFVPNVGGQAQARVEYAADSSSEPSSWTIANTLTTVAAHTLFNSNITNDIGAYGATGNGLPYAGIVKRAIYRNVVGGAVIADVDPSSVAAGETTFAEATAAVTVTLHGTAAIVDATPPTVTAASINAAGTTLTLTYSESVTGVAAADYALTSATLGTASGSGTSWTLPVSPPALNGQAPTLSYTGTATKDAANNLLATFSGMAVTNNSRYSPSSVGALSSAFGFGSGL